jgi:hypothetical protein
MFGIPSKRLLQCASPQYTVRAIYARASVPT